MIGTIARHHGDDVSLRGTLRSYQMAALDDIAACGTAACGLHAEICDHCGDRQMVANTCGNRHCPHCQNGARFSWVEERQKELLPCGYLHAVFTVPPTIGRLLDTFRKDGLSALMKAAGDVTTCLANDERYLGGTVAILQALHTWNRRLGWHPHVHQIISAGGLTADGQWRPARLYGEDEEVFLAPIDVVRAAFQKRLFRLLRDAFAEGAFDGAHTTFLPHLASRVAFNRWLKRTLAKKWCIRIEPPFGSPETVLRYLGRYVNRAAISPSRIQSYDADANGGAGQVTIAVSRSHEDGPQVTRSFSGPEFLAAFGRHVLPPGFHRIRYRGLWATAHRQVGLERARAALGLPPHPPAQGSEDSAGADKDLPDDANGGHRCQACEQGIYRPVPGPCPRPSRDQRRQALAQIRSQQRAATTQTSQPPHPRPNPPKRRPTPMSAPRTCSV